MEEKNKIIVSKEEFERELIKSCLDPTFLAGFILGIFFAIFIFYLGGYL